MSSFVRSLLFLAAPLALLPAQTPGALLTFSQPEFTQSLGGGPLQVLHPNEIAFLPLPLGCSNGAQTEKWSPRTGLQVMAGDENGDGQYWNPTLFGSIDALAVAWTNFGPIAPNPRVVFWSPAAPMGGAIASGPLRPGDVGRIDVGGQVDLLMSQDQFNIALGLPIGYPLDIDAFAYEPGLGIYFSINQPLILANPGCQTNALVANGDLLAIRDQDIVWNLAWRVASVVPNSAYIVEFEAAFDAMLQNSQITDRNGALITLADDLESLDIDHGPGSQITMFTCGNVQVPVPDFFFSTRSMTGASLVRTATGGQVAIGNCGYLGLPAPYVQTGAVLGIQGTPFQGPPSHVNALAFASTMRFVLEPQVPQQNYSGLGGPGTTVHIGAWFDYVFTWIELAPATLPGSFNVSPFSPNCFPEWYCPSNLLWAFNAPVHGFASFPTPPIPVGWNGKLLFQSVGFDASATIFELSTPAMIDVD